MDAFLTAIFSVSFKYHLIGLIHLSLFHSSPPKFIIVFVLLNIFRRGKIIHPGVPRTSMVSYLNQLKTSAVIS